ncbi:MAG: hypothetical protein CMJ62_12005 [Planctomycetaceae bacterium]|nr:hypothetical protein [Planctomycetaceae bacterium]
MDSGPLSDGPDGDLQESLVGEPFEVFWRSLEISSSLFQALTRRIRVIWRALILIACFSTQVIGFLLDDSTGFKGSRLDVPCHTTPSRSERRVVRRLEQIARYVESGSRTSRVKCKRSSGGAENGTSIGSILFVRSWLVLSRRLQFDDSQHDSLSRAISSRCSKVL